MTFKFSIGDKVVYRNFRSIVSNYLFGTGAWTITERYRGWFRRNRYVCEGLYLGGSPGRVVVSESAICIAPTDAERAHRTSHHIACAYQVTGGADPCDCGTVVERREIQS